MANNITTYLENKLLEHSVGKAPYTMPTTYVGLFINSPTVNYLTPNSITGTEVGQTNGYERKLISWNSASSGTISNSTDVTWTSTGPAFIAQDEELVQEFDVNQVGRYFRINQVP
jgi:hypothetical protein